MITIIGNLNRNQYSVYILTYHLVLVIKYRRKVINEDIFDSLMVNARIPQLLQVVDELQVGYTIILLNFKQLFFFENIGFK